MVERDDMAFQAAMMYYLQSETMDGVARHLGVSRSTVSRLLSHARRVWCVLALMSLVALTRWRRR